MNKSKLGLQIVVGLLALIPIIVGLQGLTGGVARYWAPGSVPHGFIKLDSEFAFLSGAFLGYALLIAYVIKNIDTAVWTFRLLTTGIFLGGLGRLISIIQMGSPGSGLLVSMSSELAMPLLILWQNTIKKPEA